MNDARWMTVAALAAAAITSACSTKVRVEEISSDLAAGSQVDGIPFRTKERYRLALYKLVGDKYVQIPTKETVATLANQEHLYLLRLQGSPLSKSTLKVKVNPDNTLSFINVESASKGEEVLTELGASAKAVADAQVARRKAREDAGTATETKLESGEDARLNALDAQRDAAFAQIELDALQESASLMDRTKAELKLLRARVYANQVARRARIPLPFPDAGI